MKVTAESAIKEYKRIEEELSTQEFTVEDAKNMLEKLSETFGNKSVGDMWSMGFLTTMHVTDILDLLNSQKAEIERLKEEIHKGHIAFQKRGDFYRKEIKSAKSEAIEGFAERFNSMLAEFDNYDTLHIYEIKDRLDILKEIVGDGDA